MDMSISRGDAKNNGSNKAPNNEVDDVPKFSANISNDDLNSARLVSFLDSSSNKSLAQTVAADIASKIVVGKDADDENVAHKSVAVARKNVSHSSNDEDATVKSKSVKEPTIKRKYDEPVNKEFSPGM